jgi:hypothetical protein
LNTRTDVECRSIDGWLSRKCWEQDVAIHLQESQNQWQHQSENDKEFTSDATPSFIPLLLSSSVAIIFKVNLMGQTRIAQMSFVQ